MFSDLTHAQCAVIHRELRDLATEGPAELGELLIGAPFQGANLENRWMIPRHRIRLSWAERLSIKKEFHSASGLLGDDVMPLIRKR